jgi:hypothetical protein
MNAGGGALYKPLYPPDGAPVAGFQCCHEGCKAVTRTEKGIRMHLIVCHGIRFQGTLFNDDPDPVTARDLSKGIRT